MLRDTSCKPKNTLWVDGHLIPFSLVREKIKVGSHLSVYHSNLMRTAGRLWSFLGLRALLLQRKRLH